MEDRVPRSSYGFLAFLAFVNVMNIVDRQLLPSFANYIIPELGLTNTQFGLLTGFAFIVFYSTMGLFAGALADRVHRPRLMAGGLALWSALTAASGLARGFGTLAIPRVFIGIGESVCTPTSMSMLGDRFPASRLGLAAGIYYMGVPIGVGLSLLIVGYLGPLMGWRGSFFALGGLGVCLAIALLFVKETPRGYGAARAEAPAPEVPPTLREIASVLSEALRSSPALLLTIAGGVAVHFVLGAANFDQRWFVEERGFDHNEIARWTGWIGMVGGVLGNLFGGIGGDWVQRRFSVGRPMFLFWVMLFLAPLGVVYRLVSPDSAWFWVGVFAGYFQLGSFYGPTFSTVQELVPLKIRATVVAFYLFALNLVGLGIGNTGAGILVDVLQASGVAEPYTWTLVGFTVLAGSSIPCFFFAGRRFEADRARLYESGS